MILLVINYLYLDLVSVLDLGVYLVVIYYLFYFFLSLKLKNLLVVLENFLLLYVF